MKIRILVFFLVLCLSSHLSAQEDSDSLDQIFLVDSLDIDTIPKEIWKDNSEFALYVSYGQYGFNRTASNFVSPLISNDEASFGVGIMTPLVNTRYYDAKFYLGYEQVAITETFRRSDQSLFSSTLKFRSIYAALLPINITIGNEIGGYIGAGAFAKYNISTTLESPDDLEFNVDTGDLFEKIEYGAVYQIGLFYKNVKLEFNAINSFSDLVIPDSDTLKKIGTSVSLIYAF